MNKYKIIQDSVGPKRSFTITVGLKEGYNSKNIILHDIEELIVASLKWMQERSVLCREFLPGMWKTAKMCYVHDEEQIQEPVAIFSGDVNHLYNSDLEDWEAEKTLNELASILGSTTNQTRVYLTLCDKMWILEKE